MGAPVALRFRSYQVELDPECHPYSEAMLALPVMQEWIAAAHGETEVVEKFEQYG